MICADELGPVIPRTFPPAAGWSPDGHRVKAPLEYSRGTDKTWVYGALRIRDGTEVTCCAPSRNSDGWIRLLARIAQANPRGRIRVVTDNLSSHTSAKVRGWLARHLCGPRRDRRRRAGRHRPAQRPRQTLGLGPSAATDPHPPPQVRVPPLRNVALIVHC